MKYFLFFAFMGWLLVGSQAQDLSVIRTEIGVDLQKALAELSELRQDIEKERIPLAQRLAELERNLTDRRAELARAQRFQENQLVELNALKSDAKKTADEVKYIDSLLSEYTKAFRSRLHFIEEPRYSAILEAMEKAESSSDNSASDRFSERAALLTTSLERIESALGGEQFDGRAMDKAGRVRPGEVALVGPVAMFASASGKLSGVLQQELNKTDPSVVPVDSDLESSFRTLVTSGSGQMALDATLGNAFKLTALKESLYEKIAKGGAVMIPLIALGAAALLVGIIKWLQFSRIRLASEMDLQRVLRHLENGSKDQALAHARKITGPLGDLLTAAVQNADEKREFIEELLYEKMLSARTAIERGLAFLALSATTGPLMGLLGTVMGMIATFKLISSFGSGDPKLLASGISEALIATATGMIVAIPSLLLHAFLSRKAKGIIGSMEQTAVGFMNGLPRSEKSAFAE